MGSQRNSAEIEFLEAVDRFRELFWSGTDSITVHTTGSTGVPKAIKLAISDMEASARATNQCLGIDASSTLCLALPIDYIAGKMMVVRAVVSGATFHAELPSLHPLQSLPREIADRSRIDLVAIVPSQIPGLLESPYVGIIQNVIVGGAPLSAEQEQLISRAPFRAYATYGMTETCSHVALRNITDGDSSFRCMPSVRCSTDNRGCLVLDIPEFTFRRVVTNDLAEIIDSSHFRWIGRIDNVINSGGIKVSPEQIEAKLRRAMPWLPDFVISGRPSAVWGSEVVIAVESPLQNQEEVLTEARQILGKAERPKAVVVVGPFPRRNGKILRAAIHT